MWVQRIQVHQLKQGFEFELYDTVIILYTCMHVLFIYLFIYLFAIV